MRREELEIRRMHGSDDQNDFADVRGPSDVAVGRFQRRRPGRVGLRIPSPSHGQHTTVELAPELVIAAHV